MERLKDLSGSVASPVTPLRVQKWLSRSPDELGAEFEALVGLYLPSPEDIKEKGDDE